MNLAINPDQFLSTDWYDKFPNSPAASRAPSLNSKKIETVFSGINFTQKYKDHKQKRLNAVFVLVLKIADYIFKKLGLNCSTLNRILENHQHNCQVVHIIRKMITDIDFKQLKGPENVHYEKLLHLVFSQKKVDVDSAFLIYKSLKFKSDQIKLAALQKYLKENNLNKFRSLFTYCSKEIKFLFNQAFSECKGTANQKKNLEELLQNPKILLELCDDDKKNIFQQFNELFLEFETGYADLAKLNFAKQLIHTDYEQFSTIMGSLSPKSKEFSFLPLFPSIQEELDQIELLTQEINLSLNQLRKKTSNIHRSNDADFFVYGSTLKDLEARYALKNSNSPLTVAMVGIEYAGLAKQGGLAEAIEGLTTAFSSTSEHNKARLIFPKYSHLPLDILNQLKKVDKVYLDDYGNAIPIYQLTLNHVECFFIEDETFNLDKENPNIYGPNEEILKKRFITFSKLAANVLYQMPGNDIIHLHDWHVAGVGLKLVKDHKQEWEEGAIPPIVFTFHNNNRGAQGRIHASAYNYDPVVKALQESGIALNNENMFVEILKVADAVTTVSETFSIEAQLPEFGEGISFAVQNAARLGKLVGIVNGVNTKRWNPETDAALLEWKDIDTGEPLNLSFGPLHENPIEQKNLAKEQLNKWIKRYLPQSNFTLDVNKPLVTYIGRLDSYQKGLDIFEEAIKSTLKHGGQFIIMGSQEDAQATIILDQLEKKFRNQILVLRKAYFQDGKDGMPGIGSVVRAASDFLGVFSRFEPCGLVQFESWLFGAQVIASNVGGLADTVITRQANPEHFNGYLFKRGSRSHKSISHQVSLAIQDWNSMEQEAKNHLIRRLITEGRQYSWSSSPLGVAPVQKYRRVYQLAKQRITIRKNLDNCLRFDVQDHFFKKIIHSKASVEKIQLEEEAYLSAYYTDNFDDITLEKMYYRLPESLRKELPGPFTKRIKFQTYKELGSFVDDNGVKFAINVPNAKSVILKLFDSNRLLIKTVPLSKQENGHWTTYVNGSKVGQLYQYEINGKLKMDPYGLSHVNCETLKGSPFSVICQRNDFEWTDNKWIESRIRKAGTSQPMNIYEVHPTAWKRKKCGKILNYRELANELIPYLKKGNYTHVELMGILEHAYEGSMGYQVIGFFAPNSRLGEVNDLKYLINAMHENNIQVILDWVPAHFAKNSYALSKLDGTSQFEPSYWQTFFSKRRFYNWGTSFFDFKKKDVREFLISNAVYWLKEMHFDALRVDAVRCILDSEHRSSARSFLRELNAVVHAHCPGTLTIAEDYSGNQDVSRPAYKEGLGFDMKWNVAWKHFTLKYFSQNPLSREKSYHNLIKSVESDKDHKMVLALSHDEVTESVKTLLNKVEEADLFNTYANTRLLLSFMMGIPGKKLNFMGNEFGAQEPWTRYLGRKQGLMDTYYNRETLATRLNRMCLKINELYLNYPAFWEKDDNGSNLEWIEKNDPKGQIIAYRRTDNDGESLAFLHNVTGNEEVKYLVACESHLPIEIFNSDNKEFGGNGRINLLAKLIFKGKKIIGYQVKVPPLSTVIIKE